MQLAARLHGLSKTAAIDRRRALLRRLTRGPPILHFVHNHACVPSTPCQESSTAFSITRSSTHTPTQGLAGEIENQDGADHEEYVQIVRQQPQNSETCGVRYENGRAANLRFQTDGIKVIKVKSRRRKRRKAHGDGRLVHFSSKLRKSKVIAVNSTRNTGRRQFINTRKPLDLDNSSEAHVSLEFDSRNAIKSESSSSSDRKAAYRSLRLDQRQVQKGQSAAYDSLEHDDLLFVKPTRNENDRRRKIFRPSIHIDEALASRSDPRLLPKPRSHHQHDLTYRLPQTLKSRDANAVVIERADADSRVSLQSITAKYIRAASEVRTTLVQTHKTSEPELSVQELWLLSNLGFSKADPHLWAGALLTPQTETSIEMLLGGSDSKPSKVPWFVMNYLLRREVVSAIALKGIGVLLQRFLTDEPLRNTMKSWDAIVIVCIRMLRHARNVWPQAIPQIIEIYIMHVLKARQNSLSAQGRSEKPSVSAYLTFQCNRLLSQLSLQGTTYPYLAAVIQQKAQFQLLRTMMENIPPLPLNREGHRSLTRVLVLLAKTPKERDWALLKGRTWPPFKVSKTQFDEAKDREYGTSTAGQSIEYTKLYGYSMRRWDTIAQMHAGWHIDGSPTIQTRSKYALKRVPTSRLEFTMQEDLQAAEILCTRTVPEAWAAFLKYDRTGTRSLKRLLAMFERLPTSSIDTLVRPKDLMNATNRPALPGDSKEVFTPPTSPREQLYLPSKPPDARGLLKLLVERGYSFGSSWRTADALLEKVPDLQWALKLLSSRPGPTILTLLNQHLALSRPRRDRDGCQPDLRSTIGPDKFALAIRLLTSLPKDDLDKTMVGATGALHFQGWHFRRSHPFIAAYELLLLYQSKRSKPWQHFLRACTSSESLKNAFLYDRPATDGNPLVLWVLTIDIVEHMQAQGVALDVDGFDHVCKAAFSAALSSRMLGLTRNDQPETISDGTERERRIARRVMRESSNALRQHFVNIVGSSWREPSSHQAAPTNEIPHTIRPFHPRIPRASTLHSYVRVLGILEDHEGIYSFVRWLVDAAANIKEITDGELNGSIKLRRLLVAIRVFLECPSDDYVCQERFLQIEPASAELVQLVKLEIEKLQTWGGWPLDDEIAEYTTRNVGEANKALRLGSIGPNAREDALKPSS